MKKKEETKWTGVDRFCLGLMVFFVLIGGYYMLDQFVQGHIWGGVKGFFGSLLIGLNFVCVVINPYTGRSRL